ncbi:MAG: hypothetical protein QM687_10295 [Ferruginibacter sp.]
MKFFIITSLLGALLLPVTNKVKAQSRDTVYFTAKPGSDNKLVALQLKSDSLHAIKTRLSTAHDTIPLIEQKKLLAKRDSLYKVKDSLFRKSKILYNSNDSLFRANKLALARTDALIKKNQALFVKNKMLFNRNDSLQKMKTVLHKKMMYSDSLNRLRSKNDTIRIKKNLKLLELNLKQLKEDSVRNKKNMQQVPVTMELRCNRNSTVSIRNMSRKLIIKTTTDNKVRLETQLTAEDGFDTRSLDWKKTLNIAVEQLNNEVIIKRPDTTTLALSPARSRERGDAERDADYYNQKTYRLNNKSPLTIYIPVNAKLNIENRYNEIIIQNDIKTVALDLTSTKLQMQDAEKATIKSKYGSLKAGDIKEADIELLNCKFTSGDFENIQLRSKYSNISLSKADVANIYSVSDQYKIEQVNDITATKSFGTFNIAQLDNSIKLKGSSADLEIGAISGSVRLIQVDNKYAQVKLPVEKLSNYTVQFDGMKSKVFTPFERMQTVAGDSTAGSSTFTKSIGNVKEDHTALVVNCSSCAVDFR